MCKTHSINCRYTDEDKMLYARMQITDKNIILVSAEEAYLYDAYLEKARNQDKDIVINYDESDNEPFQIMYGALMYTEEESYEHIKDLIYKMTNCAFLDITEDKVTVSGYTDMVLYPDKAKADYFIPFAALMQTPYRLINEKSSITMFPAMAGHYVWESMVNRPFLLACRESVLVEEMTQENWKNYLDETVMMNAYSVADLLMDED